MKIILCSFVKLKEISYKIEYGYCYHNQIIIKQQIEIQIYISTVCNYSMLKYCFEIFISED